ncbi:hypothetical protein [Streptomyces venezuelae]|uniref:hypothetical protein n=1 Tax=Streptomyces venezuelae TaxID=54571 RepID=UPI00378D165E
MTPAEGRPALWMFSPEGSAHLLNGLLRTHMLGCVACRTETCEEGARMRRALRAVRTVLKGPEPF